MLHRNLARIVIGRQEAHRHPVMALRRQFMSFGGRPVAQQTVGNLQQAPGPVANQGISPDGAAMVQVEQDLQPITDDLVAAPALDIGHETDAARIMLVDGVVQTLCSHRHHSCSVSIGRCRP